MTDLRTRAKQAAEVAGLWEGLAPWARVAMSYFLRLYFAHEKCPMPGDEEEIERVKAAIEAALSTGCAVDVPRMH